MGKFPVILNDTRGKWASE